jgi:hypothetical protein
MTKGLEAAVPSKVWISNGRHKFILRDFRDSYGIRHTNEPTLSKALFTFPS